MKKLILIGAGFSGACLAKLLKDKYDILVLEATDRPGGLCKSYYKEGMVYEYGPHILTNHNCSEKAVKFLKEL